MENINIFNYALATRLPVEIYNKSDVSSPILKVITPHLGTVIIELMEVDKGMFKKATEVHKPTTKVLAELAQLEYEAKNYLLSEWMTNPSKRNEK